MIYSSRIFLPINAILNVSSKVTSFLPSQKKLILKVNSIFMSILLQKMEEKLLKVLPTCTRPNFGLKLELDPQYSRAYVLDVDAKASVAKLFSSLKVTQRVIHLSYIVEIVGHCIFTKSEATTALSRIRDEGVCEFHITFAIEPTLTAK